MKQLRAAGSRPTPPRTTWVSPGSPWRSHLSDHLARPSSGWLLKENLFHQVVLCGYSLEIVLASQHPNLEWLKDQQPEFKGGREDASSVSQSQGR